MSLNIFTAGQRIQAALVNANFAYLQNLFAAGVARQFDQNDATTAGLVFGYVGGVTRSGAGSPVTVASGTVALTANATNRIELNPLTGAITAQTTGSWTVGRIPIRLIVTGEFAITSSQDTRAWAAASLTPLWGDDIEITDATKGIILKSANGTRYRVTIDNTGTLVRTAL